MSCFFNSSHDSCVNIVRYHDIDGVTYYEILIKCGKVVWSVNRRYKEFEKLNETLVMEYSLDKSWLPGKKVIGNKSKSFVKKRQEALEKYIKDVFNFLKLTMPKALVEFLDFHKYDIVFILHNLSSILYNYGENYLARSKIYTFSVLEAYSISERLKLAIPPTEVTDPKYDFSNVLDFVGMLDGIILLPMKSALPGISYDENSEDFDIQVRSALGRPIGTSCLVPDEFKFELSAFKNIKVLKVFGISSECVMDATSLRQTIERLAVQKTNITTLRQILLCDSPAHVLGEKEADEVYIWTAVKYANFSDNQMTEIDKSINLIPKVKDLILDRNRIQTISNLRSLPLLSTLSLECNLISDCSDLHIQLGNLVTLNLSQNRLRSLKGFQKFYSLVTLDVSCNLIETIDEVDYVGSLPCLENIRLTGNKVATEVDYRSRVLSRFGDRLNDIYLDNEKGSQREIDTAQVLAALRISSNIDIEKRTKESFCTISPR